MRHTERCTRALVAALALALLSAEAQAQDTTGANPDRWRRIEIPEGDTTLIDTRSIVRDPMRDEVSVWVDTRLKAPQSGSLGRNYTRHLGRMTYHCRERTVSVGSWTTFTKNGSVAGADDHPGYPLSAPVAIPPGGADEAILEAVCSPSNEQPQTRASQLNYPPTPLKLFIPPLPIPDGVRGFRLIAEYDVDETGKVVSFKFTLTRDVAYNRRLEQMLKGYKFRPGKTPDGTPVRTKAQVVYDF